MRAAQGAVWSGRVVREVRSRAWRAARGAVARLLVLALLVAYVRSTGAVDLMTGGVLLGATAAWVVEGASATYAAVRDAREVRACEECCAASASLDAARRRWTACVARRHVMPLPLIAGLTASDRTEGTR